MATQVEVSSALASLTNIGDLRNEATLQQAFVSSLSDTGGKTGDHPGPLVSPLVLEERSKFGTPLGPSAMAPAASRPRLTPRPFSREKPSETFAVVKPPVPTLKTGPNSSVLAKTSEDAAAAKGLTGNVPPLLDQKLIENKSPRELVANMPFYSAPQANTVILFETGNNEKGKVRAAPEKTPGASEVQQEQLSSSKPETSHRKPEGPGVRRQLSLSSESRPVSWAPRKSLERKDTFVGAGDAEQEESRASEVQLRPKQRPVSAIFLESLKDQKQSGPDVSDETKPEKPWVRKPRPLSMDLTAKFENFSVQRKPCLPETKETAGLSPADSSKSNPKSTTPVADCVKSRPAVPTQKPSLEEVSPPCRTAPKDLNQVSARDRKNLWEVRLKNQDDQNERETDAAETSEKGKGLFPKERADLSQKESRFGSESSVGAPEVGSKTLKGVGVKKPSDFPDSLANGSPAVKAESLPESSGEETRAVNIQQRIKELTADNVDAKPGNLRRSFRSRPLPSDLTKLFSGPSAVAEMKPERQTDVTRKAATEAQDVPEKEKTPQYGTEGAGIPWKSPQNAKTSLSDERPKRDGGSVKERQSASVPQGDSPASVAVHDIKTHPIPPPENVGVKTVRATMFEHNVERHTIAANHLGTEPKSQLTHDSATGPLGHFWESRVERVLDAKGTSRWVPSRQADVPVDAEKPRKTRTIDEDKTLQATAWEKLNLKERYEKTTPKPVEDSVMYQRIEPRYEILQTVGGRVQSEAITTVPEDKAVTLRSRRSLKERRRTDGSVTGAAWARSLEVQGDGWKEEDLVPKVKDPGEGAAMAALAREVKASSHEQITEGSKNWTGQQQATVKASYFANRSKDWERAEEKASKLSAETERERREVIFSNKTAESSATPKHFPGSSGVELGRTDGYEAKASVEKNPSSSVMGERESQPVARRTSQWQAFTNRPSTHLSRDPQRTHEQDEPKVLIAHGAQEESDVSSRGLKGDGFQEVDVDEKVRRSGRGISAPKSVERWRRKTLPHNATRFEEAGVLSQEKGKSPSRRDSFQLWDSSIAKRSPGYGGEVREGRPGPPSSPDSGLKNQLSPSELKATYFALTYQISDESKNVASKAPDLLKNKQVPLLAANASIPPSASMAKTAPLANRSHGKRFPGMQGSLDRHLSRNGEESEASEIPPRGLFKYPLTEARNESQTWAKERETDFDFPFHGSGTKSPSRVRPLHQDSEHPGQKKSADQNQGPNKDKPRDGYRSGVLDLDVLMAEYKEDSKRVSPIQREGSLPEESSVFSWEKSAYQQYSAGRTPCSYAEREPKRADLSPGGRRQEISVAETFINEREVLETYGQDTSPLIASDAKGTPPHWGRQVMEKPKGSLLEQIGTQKKTFIVDEDQGEGLVLRHQSAKHYGAQVCTDIESRVGFAPPSHLLAEGASWKGMKLKRETDVPKEGGQRADTNLTAVSKRKAGASEGSFGNDAFAAKSGLESGSAVPSLANVPPELRRSYSEKVRQSRGKGGGLPFSPAAQEKVEEQSRVRQSFPLENSDSRLSRRSASPHGVFLSEGKKPDVEKDGTKPGHEGPMPRNSPYLPMQRRSRSFYRDRRTDHWPTDQLKQCFGRPAADAKDTDTLVQEADNQYGTWRDQRDGTDSFVPESPSSESVSALARKPASGGSRLSSFSSQTEPASTTDPPDSSRDDRRSASLDRYSADLESADGTEFPAPSGTSPDFSFLEQTLVLDSSALKTRVQLSKRRRQRRAPISQSLRRSGVREEGERWTPTRGEADSAWMFRDSTGEKPSRREDSDEEGSPRPTGRSPAPQPQRLPVFPGMDHSALKAQLRKRHEAEGMGGGGIPAQSSRSPKSPFQAGALPGTRMLPREKEERSEEVSPQWLKDLKTKKRQSQCENQV